ncbi:tetratricopeptide repeat protein [Nakamurella lactea]|uniref:tetratricopeptide repeat protein n=1 Tax=Nakamurella lactea TaxID=459515 RepID=UPI0004266BD9|nr:tetratricopeptide repeat protein [Nakamurella lactea]
MSDDVSDDSVLDPAVLDDLWDFDDPAGSEGRLRAAAAGATGSAAAELTTQVARALGLQERFSSADELLATLGDHPSPLVRARRALEAGRVRRSAGDQAASVPQFEAALALATEAGDDYLRVDTMHMLALVDPAGGDSWTDRALTAAEAAADPRTRRWAGALHNNRGWDHYDQQRYPQALADFEQALEVYRRYGSADQVRFAEQAVAEARTALQSNGG